MRRSPPSPAVTFDLGSLLSRRILFVTGKGGTGKSTLAGALALRAADLGKRVLCVDVDVKGDLARALGADHAGFRPQVAQPGVSVLALRPEESLQEYLRIYFHVPALARLTPLASVFDFVAGSIPGTREMLVIGKIAFEEKRVEAGRPVWDLIVVDAAATGHALPQLTAARSLMEMTRGGIIRSQTEWVAQTLTDARRTQLVLCALPQEMAVVEAVELYDRARREAGVTVGVCFLNRAFTIPVGERSVDQLERLQHEHPEAAAARLGAGPALAAVVSAAARLGAGPALAAVVSAGRVAQRLHADTHLHLRALRTRLDSPVVAVPLQAATRPGLAMTRAVAATLQGAG